MLSKLAHPDLLERFTWLGIVSTNTERVVCSWKIWHNEINRIISSLPLQQSITHKYVWTWSQQITAYPIQSVPKSSQSNDVLGAAASIDYSWERANSCHIICTREQQFWRAKMSNMAMDWYSQSLIQVIAAVNIQVHDETRYMIGSFSNVCLTCIPFIGSSFAATNFVLDLMAYLVGH